MITDPSPSCSDLHIFKISNLYFNAVYTVHHLKICIETNKMYKILVIRLYFPLDALYVPDCISPSSGATFISCTSHLVYAGTIRVVVVWL